VTVQHELSAQARNFNWLLTSFVEGTSGVTLAVAVSSDGLLMAMSNSIDRATAEQLSAIIAGMASLGHSTARCFGLGGLDQVIIALQGGFLFVSSVSDGSSLGVLASRGCDIGSVGYQIGLLVERAGSALTPALVAELKESVLG
jgi:predicted regulator of Ras-like GTPase activity (Roadblock/LC7/MglB family)